MQRTTASTLTRQLTALSPLDGRYRSKVMALSEHFSELALIRSRILAELLIFRHFLTLSGEKVLTLEEENLLKKITESVTVTDGIRVKEFESKTRHDVKAIEYFLREKLHGTSLEAHTHFLHFGITSEDVNNLAYRHMLQQATHTVVLPKLKNVLQILTEMASEHAELPMLARTHGQAAIPTTLGKEIAVFGSRLLRELQKIEQHRLSGKLSGAVGGYHALTLTYPEVSWSQLSENVTHDLGLEHTPLTTQIAPPEDILELLQCIYRVNGILLDFSQDIWRYTSDGWLIQKGKSGHVGSSTMPQKINPIEFENAEGNLTVTNGLIETLVRKLPVSRLQRDLSESTVARNYGVVFGHALLAYSSLEKGLMSIQPHKQEITAALTANWNILSEALQVVARKQGDTEGYEHAAAAVKGKNLTQEDWQTLVQNTLAATDQNLDISTLQRLTPTTYLGYSVELTHQAVAAITKYLKGSADA